MSSGVASVYRPQANATPAPARSDAPTIKTEAVTNGNRDADCVALVCLDGSYGFNVSLRFLQRGNVADHRAAGLRLRKRDAAGPPLRCIGLFVLSYLAVVREVEIAPVGGLPPVATGVEPTMDGPPNRVVLDPIALPNSTKTKRQGRLADLDLGCTPR